MQEKRWLCNKCGEIFLEPQDRCPWCGGSLYEVIVPTPIKMHQLYTMLTKEAEWNDFIQRFNTIRIAIATHVKFFHKNDNEKWEDGMVALNHDELRKFLWLLYDLHLIDSCEVLNDTLMIRKDW